MPTHAELRGSRWSSRDRPSCEVAACACGLVRHQRLPGRGQPSCGDVVLRDAERGQLVLRQIHPAELPVLANVAHDVDQLERDAERLRALRLVGTVDPDARDADRPGDMGAVARELVEGAVALAVEIHQPAVDQVVQRLRGDREALPCIGQRDPHRLVARPLVEAPVQLLEKGPLLVAEPPLRRRCRRPRARRRRSPRSRAASASGAP